jgi:hypothetical protein
MILEERRYLLRPGAVAKYLRLVKATGLPVMRQELGGLVGYFVAETGTLHEVVHLWAYEDMADRERRRAGLNRHASWQEFLNAILPLMERMETRIFSSSGINPVTLDAIRSATAAWDH